jgi:3-oxoacyl-[acyl-carrier-protein] synthase II
LARRVVVTGIGLLCGVGNTAPEVWDNLLAGKSGMAPIASFDTTGFPVTFAAEVKKFNPLDFMDKKEARKMGRFIHFALAATQEALTHSGLKIGPANAERVGVHIGSGIGGFDVIEREHTAMLQGGPRKISPFFIPGTIVNLVSIRYGALGPNEATSTACTTSAHSVGNAFRTIERDDADVMIAGGAEAAITPMPFDKDRDGFVVGEGAGILILEELEHARAREAKILAEIIGYGMSADAYHITSMAPQGEGCLRAMKNALRSAQIEPSAVDYVNAHATSTPLGDALETAAIKSLFGEHATSGRLRVSSTKSMTGHLLGGAGGLEAGITIMALQRQVVPPTTNLDDPDPACDLNYIANKPEAAKVEVALSNSFGFGGTNGALIFRRWPE